MGGDPRAAHPNPAELDRFLMGELSAREAALIVAHLLAGCDDCRDQMAPLADVVLSAGTRPPEEVASPSAEYDFPLFRAFATARRYSAALDLERAEAALEVPRLRAVPPPPSLSATEKAERDWRRCESFVERAWALRFRDPEGMVLLSSMALTLANRLDPSVRGKAALADMQSRAQADLGNARRITGDFAGAEEDLNSALARIDAGTGEPAILIRLIDFTASLWIDQQRFTDAFHLLDGLYQVHLAQRDLHNAGRVLVSKAIAADKALNPDEGFRLLAEGLRLIDARRDPKLVLAAIHNLLSYLVDAGRVAEASHLLAESQNLYAAYAEPLHTLRAVWLEGRIAAELEDTAAAERAYQKVRDGFAAAGLPIEAALVSLDLAAVWLRAGRTREIRVLIDEVARVLQAHHVRREAIGALLLLRRACEREVATAALFRSVAAELQRFGGARP